MIFCKALYQIYVMSVSFCRQLIKPARDFLQQWPRQLFSFHRSSVWEFLQKKINIGIVSIMHLFIWNVFDTVCFYTLTVFSFKKDWSMNQFLLCRCCAIFDITFLLFVETRAESCVKNAHHSADLWLDMGYYWSRIFFEQKMKITVMT